VKARPGGRRGLLARLDTDERNRFVPLLALAYGTGAWLAPRVAVGAWPLWLLPAAALLAAALFWCRFPLRWALLPLALMAALFWTQAKLNPVLPAAGYYDAVTATVYGEPSARESGGFSLTLADVTLNGVAQPGRAYCTLDGDEGVDQTDLFDGAALRFRASVYHPSGKENEYDFDFRLWLLQSGVGYGITGVKDLEILNTPQTAPWASFSARVRAFCSERFTSLMGYEGGLAGAMLLGNRDGLQQDEQAAFRRAGVAHLMAVSGLHVGLLAVALGWLLNALCVRKTTRLVSMAAFLALYCMVTGFSPASVRAAAMALFILLAKAVGRKPDPLATLSAAAVVVLAINPLELFSAGFVLSFSAMAGIMLLYPRIFKGLEKAFQPGETSPALRRFTGRDPARVRGLLSVSLAAQIGVLLPTAAYYHQLPLYGVLFNLVAVPLASLLVPLYAVTLLASLLPWVGGTLGAGLGFAAKWGSWLMLRLVELSDRLPYAQVRVPSPNGWAYAGLLLGALAVSGFVRAPRRRRAAALALVAVLACGGAYLNRPAALRYHQFAAGSADAALIVDGDMTVAVDVGTTGYEVADRLLAEGRSLDALILTHLHLDHAQGVEELLSEQIPIARIYLPSGAGTVELSAEARAVLTLLENSGIPITYLSAGDTLTFHEMSIEVLWPEAGRTREGIDANDRSMATLIRLGNLRILNMADNGSLYENYFAVPCDVLKVGHHGSAEATSDAFLDAADPAMALITCGKSAAEATLARLAAHGVQTLRTGLTGEIRIEAAGDGYRISTYKTGADDEP